MNTLTIIKKHIEKASRLHDAQINITKYRGVDCKVHEAGEDFLTAPSAIAVKLTPSDIMEALHKSLGSYPSEVWRFLSLLYGEIVLLSK